MACQRRWQFVTLRPGQTHHTAHFLEGGGEEQRQSQHPTFEGFTSPSFGRVQSPTFWNEPQKQACLYRHRHTLTMPLVAQNRCAQLWGSGPQQVHSADVPQGSPEFGCTHCQGRQTGSEASLLPLRQAPAQTRASPPDQSLRPSGGPSP